MPTSHHRPLRAEVFEDRVLPSGVFPDFRSELSGPPRPHGGGFGDYGPGPDRAPGFRTDDAFRFDPRPAPGRFREEVVVLTVVPAPAAAAPPAASPHGASAPSGSIVPAHEEVEEVTRTAVTPSGLNVTLPARFVPVADPRPLLGPDLLAQPAPQAANPARAPELPAVQAQFATGLPATGVPPAATGTFLAAAAGAGAVAEPATSAARPITLDPDVVIPEGDPAVPIEVDVPGGVPLAGLLGLDTAAVEGQVRRLIDRVSDLAAELPEGLAAPDAWSWLATAAVLTGAAGYALWSNRSKPRAGLAAVGPDSVLVRWGEENDAGVR